MRKFALILPLLLLGACQSSSSGSSEADDVPTVRDVARMQSDYASRRHWAELGRTIDGRTNALDRDLGSVWSTVNRHFFNYSESDPYVNFETDETYLSVLLWQTADGVIQNTVPFIPFSSYVLPDGGV